MSKENLSAFYNLASKRLDQHILSHSREKVIKKVLEGLPMLSFVNLELRLEKDNPAVDVNILVRNYECQSFLKKIENSNNQELHAFIKWCKDWMNPKMPFYYLVPHIWIMYDLPDSYDHVPTPWVIISFRKLAIGKQAEIELIKKVIAYFADSYGNRQWQIFERIYAQLPKNGIIPAVGIQNRTPRSLRTGVKPFHSLKAIEDYLLKIGWKGDFTKIRPYQELVDNSDFAAISLTFNDSLFEDIGIENWVHSPNQKVKIKRMLDRLSKDELCTEAKKKAILNFIGTEKKFPELWSVFPEYFQSQEAGYLDFWLSELKIAYSEQKGLYAKAYINFERKFRN